MSETDRHDATRHEPEDGEMMSDGTPSPSSDNMSDGRLPMETDTMSDDKGDA
jgi:hypothetical protein